MVCTTECDDATILGQLDVVPKKRCSSEADVGSAVAVVFRETGENAIVVVVVIGSNAKNAMVMMRNRTMVLLILLDVVKEEEVTAMVAD